MMHDPIRHNRELEPVPPDDQSDRIPEPDTFPAREPVEPAVSFEQETRNQLNILRERTFNPELRQLVDRIRINEPSSGQAEYSAITNVDELSYEELNLQLYRLYYKARNIQDNLDMNISFDPFKEIDNFPAADIRSSIAAQFTGMMRHLSFTPFALFSYDMTVKGYIPKIHNLEGFDVDNIIISLKDGLFQKLLSARDGIMIDSGMLRDDFYMEKIFSLPDDGEGRSLYFILINNIIEEVVTELSDNDVSNAPSFLPSALLMIVFMEGGVIPEPVEIARIARERLSMPLYVLNDKRSYVFSLERFDDLSYTFDILEFFFTLFLLKKDRVGISLHVQKTPGTNMQYMMKYIISKLNNKLCSDSVIINVLKDSLIILTEKPYVKTISGIFEEFNALFNDSFIINEFRASDYIDAHDIIQKIIINN